MDSPASKALTFVSVPKEATEGIRLALERLRGGSGDNYVTPEQAGALWADLLAAATPPAQAAEAVERVAMALLIQQTGDPSQGADEQWRSVMTGTRQTYIALARAAIAAMQAGE